MGDRGVEGRGGGGAAFRTDSTATLSQIPKESDRKAVLGCLGGVLNILCAHLYEDDDKLGPSFSTGTNNIEDDLQTSSMANFSVRERVGDDDSISTSSNSKFFIVDERRKRTARFQRDLLKQSAKLLFLPPDTATVFLPNLDIHLSLGEDGNDADQRRRELLLDPFLQSLSSSEESFQCLALLLFRFLLTSSGGDDSEVANENSEDVSAAGFVGYDARVRATYKALAVAVLSHWDLKENWMGGFLNRQAAVRHATRKFENLEDLIAERISAISKLMQQQDQEKVGKEMRRGASSLLVGKSRNKSMGQHVTRSLKIAGAGIAAGTLFAVTGGLATPAIIGGIAALTGMGTFASVAATLLMIPAAATLFGVAGGGLVAKKMSTRTSGLGEFYLQRVHSDTRSTGGDVADTPELSRSICISGWVRDNLDFERPWGIQLSRSADRCELLGRFCSVFAPHALPQCSRIIKEWKGKEGELWQMLREAYGKDPDSLLPMCGLRQDSALSSKEVEALDGLVRAMELPLPPKGGGATKNKESKPVALLPPVNLLDVLSVGNGAAVDASKISHEDRRAYHTWDFQSNYGGEQYIISWESKLLAQLSNSTVEFQKDLAKSAAGEALKKTALSSLMAAIALPATLLSLTNVIDETWTLVAERADEAGIVLAKSLLESDGGHRPVSLIGFSFGARVIVSCLFELARQQRIWEQNRLREIQGKGKEPPISQRKSIMRRISSRQATSDQMDYSSKPTHQPSGTREPASVVEDVVLMGCPASISSERWIELRSIVGGRLVNCYSRSDLMLSILFRVLKNGITKMLSPPAGIREVVGVSGVESYDVTEIVSNHGEYIVSVKEILDVVGYGEPTV